MGVGKRADQPSETVDGNALGGEQNCVCPDTLREQRNVAPHTAAGVEVWHDSNPQGVDFDFIEIGTSNFETLIQLATNATTGKS